MINYLTKNKLAKETFWSFLAKGVTAILFFATNIFLARKLGVESFGQWSYLLSFFTIVSLVGYFGINASARKFVAQHQKNENLKSIIYDSTKLRLYFSLFFCVILFFIYKPLTIFIGKPELSQYIYWFIGLVFFSSFVEFLKEVFTGLHRLKYNLIINSLEFLLKFLFVVFLLSIYNSIDFVIQSHLYANLIAGMVGFYFLYFNFYRNLDSNGKHYLNEIFRYSFPLFIISVGFVVATEFDTMMIGYFKDDYEVGIFSVAKQIIVKLPQISLAISMGVMPIFAQLNENNKLQLRKTFYKLIKLNSWIFLAIILIIFIFGNYLIVLSFGEKYLASALVLKMLTPYLFFFSTSVFLASFLDYTGHAGKRSMNLLVAIALNILLNIFLVPKYGSLGAAIATSISYLPYVIMNWREVYLLLK